MRLQDMNWKQMAVIATFLSVLVFLSGYFGGQEGIGGVLSGLGFLTFFWILSQ